MPTYEFASFQLCDQQRLLTHNGAPVHLGPKVVETLLAFVERPGEVLAKSTLLDRVWPERFVEESNLSQNVHVLRRTFRSYGIADPIETIPCRGYRFTAMVHRLGAAPMRAPTVSPRRAWILPAALASALLVSAVFVASSAESQRSTATAASSDRGTSLFQAGRYYWNLRTPEGVQKSLIYFAQVIDADPGNARGYAALAEANATMGDYCYGTHLPSVYFARARAYAQNALALDPRSAEAHAALGLVSLGLRDASGARAELERAIAIDPSYAPAHEWNGIAMLSLGRLPQGVDELKRAAELDPLSVSTLAWLGSAAYRQGRFREAILYSREALELSPRRIDALETLGEAYEVQGNLGNAIAAFERYGAIREYYRAPAAALLAPAYARARRFADARAQSAYARAHPGPIHDVSAAIYA